MNIGERALRRRLQGNVVVVTGASSGIGRAAALRFATLGCRVVVAARREASLHDVAAECEACGGSALVVATDMTKGDDIRRLVNATLTRWGRIDVWVNNAGTTLFARLDEGDFAAHRRVIETNLIGPMYAARLIAPIFRRQHSGTLINIGSVLSQVGQAFVPSYVISKFGLHGLSEAVRSDFADEDGIQICTVFPYATDTRHFEDGGNETGRRAYAMPPVQNPETVADAIVEVAARPRRERYVPRYVALGLLLHWLAPETTERLLHDALNTFHLSGRQTPTAGNLYEPSAQRGTVRGTRRPIISRTAFLIWLAADLLRLRHVWRRPPLREHRAHA